MHDELKEDEEPNEEGVEFNEVNAYEKVGCINSKIESLKQLRDHMNKISEQIEIVAEEHPTKAVWSKKYPSGEEHDNLEIKVLADTITAELEILVAMEGIDGTIEYSNQQGNFVFEGEYTIKESC